MRPCTGAIDSTHVVVAPPQVIGGDVIVTRAPVRMAGRQHALRPDKLSANLSNGNSITKTVTEFVAQATYVGMKHAAWETRVAPAPLYTEPVGDPRFGSRIAREVAALCARHRALSTIRLARESVCVCDDCRPLHRRA